MEILGAHMKTICIKFLTAFLILCFSSGCGSNAFKEMSDKTSDDAKYFDAKVAMDNQDWDTAIAKFESITGSLASNRTFLNDKAAAYAGKCGLQFISYFNSLSTFSITGSTIFKALMDSVKTTSVNATSCATAESIMTSIGLTASLRTSDENLFMLLLSMFKVGAYLKTYVDPTGTGTATAGINLCTVQAAGSTGSSAIPTAEMRQIASGWSHFVNNISAFSLFPAAVQTAVTTLTGAVCATFASAGVSGDPCKTYDPSNASNGMTTVEYEEAVNTVRDMLKTGPTTVVAAFQIGVQEAADTPCNPTDVATFRACCAYAAGSP
jgi:hypothetical protein